MNRETRRTTAGGSPLATPDGIRWLRQQRSSTAGTRRRKAQLLLEAATLSFLHSRTAEAEDRLSQALGGRLLGVPLASFGDHVLAEDDPGERARLEGIYAVCLRDLETLWLARLAAQTEAAGEAGYRDFPSLVWDVFDLDGEAFLESCLAITSSARTVGSAVALRDWIHSERRVLARVGRAASPDSLVEAALSVVRCLGLSRPSHLEVRFLKSDGVTGGRAFSEWQAGSDTAVVVIHQGEGLIPLPELLHEAGHAAEGSSRDPEKGHEFAGLVDLAVSEAWAFVFAAAAFDPAFLAESAPPVEAARVAGILQESARFVVLKYAALTPLVAGFLGSRSFLQPGLYPAAYTRTLVEATGIWHCPETAYADTDDLWRMVAYLRGYALAARTLERLADRPPVQLDLADLAAHGALVSTADLSVLLGGPEDMTAAGRYGRTALAVSDQSAVRQVEDGGHESREADDQP